MVEVLAAAIERAKSTDAVAVAKALEVMKIDAFTLGGFRSGAMRATDHQFIQPLYVSLMERAGTPGVTHDNEGSGYSFRTVRYFAPRLTERATTCKMSRP